MIGIDWEGLATWDNYFKAAQNSMRVGKYAGDLLVKLIQEVGVQHQDVYGVGHSLGGQGMGHFARRVKEVTGIKIARITRKILFFKPNSRVDFKILLKLSTLQSHILMSLMRVRY